jgi:Tol biopolymer transport system component/C-terminal processing protease CtpA/Prc
MKLRWLAGAALAAPLVMAGAAAAQEPVTPAPSLAEPSLSPDGGEVAFVSGGDIWSAPAAGGTARLLVTDAATEGRPLWSPDGRELAFTSTRNGVQNIYVLTLASGAVRRLTYSDAGEQLDAWSRDGQWIYFSSGAGDVARQNDIYRVSARGGTPLEVSRERYLGEFQAAPSPDGASIAFMAKGNSWNQWWRNGHSHIDEAELWIKPVAEGAAYRRLLGASSKRLWPMWSPDGATLYFMSDEDGTENLWRLPVAGGQPEQLTRFKDGRVLFPSIAADGRAIVFERDFGVWRLDLATGQAAPIPITLRGAPAGAGDRRLSETSFREMALSPDGKKVALIVHGEVFAAAVKDGGPAQRISETPAGESDLAWSPDSRRLAYVSQRGLDQRIVEYDFVTREERVLTAPSALQGSPTYSPDGKALAYVRDRKEVRLLSPAADRKAATDRALYASSLTTVGDTPLTWSPDSRWVAFALTDRKSFRNVHVVPAAGGEARPVSFLANGNTASRIAWSADGQYIVFDTAQRSEDVHLVRVDLLPKVPKYREDAFRELFDPRTPPQTEPGPTPEAPVRPARDAEVAEGKVDEAGKTPLAKARLQPVRIVFDGIRERASFLPLGLSAEGPVISPDGKTLLFTASLAGQESLYEYSLDELAKEPPVPLQVAASKKPKDFYAFTPDSKQIVFLDGGVVTTSPVEEPKPKPVAINAEMDVRFDQEKQVVFDQAWSMLNHSFYDPKFHGADWPALRARFAPRIAGARTPDEMRRLINLMIGELNASHSGINRPTEGFGAAPAQRVGDLGLRFDRQAYEAGRGLVVREVVNLGPAFVEGSIRAGDTLLAVEGRAIGPTDALDRLLTDRAGRRTELTVRNAAGATRQVVLRPVTLTVATGLLYRQWVNDRRAYVEKVSGGRLGYVHIADMSQASLDQLYIDLDAANQGKDGVVIDLRNNNGGFVNGYVLDVFARKNFLTMTMRDSHPVPSRQALGQRALGLPTALVINESSLSDAEDFTEGYRTLGLGKVVGVPTAGWIIYTWNVPLIDGSVVRLPRTRIDDLRGQNMELNPRPVDVRVERALGEGQAGRDSQLDAAVATLLQGLSPAAGR